MPYHTQEKLHYQTEAPMDILLNAKSKLSASNCFRDIKIQKVMQSDWSIAFSITTQELAFSQPCGSYRFLMVVYH